MSSDCEPQQLPDTRGRRKQDPQRGPRPPLAREPTQGERPLRKGPPSIASGRSAARKVVKGAVFGGAQI
eukprot:scaffold2329_cov247-Pinguiococcus_pyrenoidosus.AAC.26